MFEHRAQERVPLRVVQLRIHMVQETALWVVPCPSNFLVGSVPHSSKAPVVASPAAAVEVARSAAKSAHNSRAYWA